MTDAQPGLQAAPRAATPDKTVPHSVPAEEAVLGSVLINPDALYDVMPVLRPEDFYIVRHAWIYQSYLDLHDRREPIDYVTVVEELEQQGRLAEVGGPAYISHLINVVPTAVNAEAYGRIIEDTAVRRRLLSAASQVAQLVYEEERPVAEVIDRSEQVIFAVSERRIARELRPIKQVIHDYYDRIEYLREHQGEIVGVPTGFIDVDRLLGGLQKSDMIIVAARPGMGKTSFALSVALNAARKHQRVAIFSLEMAAEQIVGRMLSAETRLDSQRLRLGNLDEDEWALLTQAVARLADLHIFLDDTPSITPLQLRTKCRRLYAEYGLDLVIVDYIQLMSGEGRNENRVQEVSYISRAVKALARELNLPVISVAQLSRSVEQRQDKRPLLSDLRESGSLEQDADVVMFIHREEMYDPDTERKNMADIVISKHRNGPTGDVELYFDAAHTQFHNALRSSVDLNV
jgi:replicative DNA helicase